MNIFFFKKELFLKFKSLFKNSGKKIKGILLFVGFSGVVLIIGLIYNVTKFIQSTNELMFSDDELGIIVSEFINEEEYKRYISDDYLSILPIRAKDEGIENFKIKKPNENLKLKIKNFEEAEKIAEKYNPKIIIFGYVNKKGVYPSIHFNKKYREKYNIRNKSLLKKELFGNDIHNDIEFSSITEDQILISMYINAIINIEQNQFKKAANNLLKLINKNNNYIYKNYNLYRMLSACYIMSGDFKKSELILKNRLDIQKDELTASLYLINYFMKNTTAGLNDSEKSYYINEILKYKNILSWQHWDNLYLVLSEMELASHENRYIQKINDRKLLDVATSKLSESNDEENLFFANFYKFSTGKNVDNEKFLKIKNDDTEEIATIKLISSVNYTDIFKQNYNLFNEKFEDKIISKYFKLIYEETNNEIKVTDLELKYEVYFKNSFLYQFIYYTKIKNTKNYTYSLYLINNLIKINPTKYFLLKERISLYIEMEKVNEAFNDLTKYLKKYKNDNEALCQYYYICSLIKNDICKETINENEINFKFYDISISEIYNNIDKYVEYFPDAEFISNIKEIQRKIVLSETKSAYTFLEKTKNDYQIFISQNKLISTFLDYIEEIIKLIELDTNDGNLFLQKTQQNFPTKEYQLFDRKNLYSKNTKFYFNYKQSINDLLLILHVLNTMYLNLDLDKLLMLLSSEDLIYNDQYCSKHELLGKIYFKKHNINDAASQFLKALDCNENLFFPNYFLGDYYFFSKKEKSEKYLEKSIQLKNDCSECYLLLSKHYERKGDDNNRKKFRDKGIQLHMKKKKNILDITQLDWLY